ncbi:inactive protein RESTRICTED TEV MOVEMENT 2-like [Neltuma alba]|uniref:inactive protein RESTRICTED TEV MOVEMENT 2-like n=1 Tax=Neltuma alba TaxID=207710 RepID=UPI0010A4672E|nr:inactive protein RESTRICTED TEV MOVEMENT 2-like [Prosopis alba]
MASTQTYEDFKPLVEEKDSPDALLLLVHIPGFTKEQIGASFEPDTRKIRVFGEKPLPDNKRKRFTEERVIPETCDFDKLKGKFDGTIVTITIPKKPISSVTPKEPKPAQEATKQVTPPTAASAVESEGSTKEGEKGVSQEQPKSDIKSQRESDKKKDETPTPPEKTGESQMPQKDKEQLPQKGIKEEEKHRDEMETKDASTPRKPKGESRTAQKDQEGTPQKGKLDDEKHEKNKSAEKERIQEDNSKTSEAGKAPQKVQTLAGEARKEKGSSSLKAPEKTQKETDAKLAATRLADKFREEDKQKLLYAGAAILMVAVGIYASFKLRSQARQ